MFINDAEPAKPSDISKLLLVSRASGSFVSAMELPDVGITLHFIVPPEGRRWPRQNRCRHRSVPVVPLLARESGFARNPLSVLS